MHRSIALAGLLALGACTADTVQNGGDALSAVGEALGFASARAFVPADGAAASTGTVYVVAEEHGELHTYSLRPCRGGTRICGGAGGVGHLQRTEAFDIVTGAYPHRVFYLSPGGDGILKWRGVERDLAWD